MLKHLFINLTDFWIIFLKNLLLTDNFTFVTTRARSKIDVSGEQLDPDKDITKPTNRTGEAEMEDDDYLELSDQQRKQR